MVKRILLIAIAVAAFAVIPVKAQTHSNTLSWGAVSNVNGYNVYKAPASCVGTFVKLTVTPITALTYTDTGMVDGEVNCYYVTSVVNTPPAESPRSNTVLITTPTSTSSAGVPPPVVTAKNQ